jgi:succinoglycan biosynthesis protein ExoA
MTVSIIVPCRNEKDYVGPFIDSLIQQKGFHEFQVIIADGDSDDGTGMLLDAVSKKFANIVILSNPKKIVSSGLNLALARSSGEVIVRMDMHTTYEPDYVHQCVDTLLTADSEVWCVGGPWQPQPNESFVGRAISEAFNNRVVSGNSRSRDLNYFGTVDTVYLGCWRKDELIELGGFDEELVRNQDDELCLRIRLNFGKKILQNPKIRSYYEPRSSLAKLFMQYYQYGYWKAKVAKKHGQFGSYRHWIFFLLPFFCLPVIVLNPLTIMWLSGIYFILLLAGTFASKKRHSFFVRLASLAPGLIMHVSYYLGLIVSALRLDKVSFDQETLTR